MTSRRLLLALGTLLLGACDVPDDGRDDGAAPVEPAACECDDDGIDCTSELCDRDGVCQHRADDRLCAAGGSCAVGSCDVETGGCVLAPRPTGVPCAAPTEPGAPRAGCFLGECLPGRVVGLETVRMLELPERPATSADAFSMDLARVQDRTGDGIDEVAVNSVALDALSPRDLPGRVHLFDATTGAVLWTASGSPGSTLFGYRLQTIGDVTADGLSDLASTERVRGTPGVVAIDGSTGDVVWRFEEPAASYARFTPAGDQDGDGVEDLVVVIGQGLAVVSGADGTIVTATAGTFGPNVTTVADLDGDGLRDIVSDAEPALYRYVRVVSSATLEDLAVFDLASEHVWVSGTAPDLSGDGIEEVLLTHSDGLVREREARDLVTGEVLWVQRFPRAAPIATYDLDGDGIGDLLTDGRLERTRWRSLVALSGADGSVAFETTPVDARGAIAPIDAGFIRIDDLDGNGTDDFAVGDELLGARVWLLRTAVAWF